MDEWQTVSSLATGVGTLVLAVATFSAVRSANRSARVADGRSKRVCAHCSFPHGSTIPRTRFSGTTGTRRW